MQFFAQHHFLQRSLTLCLLLGLLVACLEARVLLAPLRGRYGHLALLLGTVLIGAWLRLYVAPAAPMNISEYERTAFAAPVFEGEPDPDSHFFASVVFIRLVFSVLHVFPHPGALFPVMITLGLLSIPLLFLLGAHLFQSVWTGQIAALLLAVCVIPVRFSASANTATVAVFVVLTALLCLTVALRDPRRALLFAGGALTIFAALTHGEIRLIVPVSALLFHRAWRQMPRRSARDWWPLAALGVLGLPALLILSHAQSKLIGTPRVIFLEISGRISELVARLASLGPEDHTSLVGPVLGYALFAGVLICLQQRRRLPAAVCGLWMLGLFMGRVLGGQNEPNCVFADARYELGWAPALYLLAAVPFATLLERERLRWNLVGGLTAGMVALLQVTSAGFDTYRTAYNDQQEYQFLAANLPQLTESTVLLPPHCEGCYHYAEAFTLLRAAFREELTIKMGRPANGESHPIYPTRGSPPTIVPWPPEDPPEDRLVYIGLYCYVGQNHVPRWRPECQALRERFTLEPVAAETFPNRPYRLCPYSEYLAYQNDPHQETGEITIGFFRLHSRAGVARGGKATKLTGG